MTALGPSDPPRRRFVADIGDPTLSHLARAGLERHLEGWQAGLVTITMVALAAALVAPQTTPRPELPLPRVNATALRRLAEASRERAARAYVHPLPYEVRAVGHALRRFGTATHREQLERHRRAMVEATVQARREHGDEPLLALRAVQTHLFLHAVSRWQAEGDTNTDLLELGGTFADDARAHRWWRDGSLLFTPAELAALFRIRWVRLVGLQEQPPFAPTVHEWRAYYRGLLRATARETSDPAMQKRSIDLIGALAQHAPQYPATLARGIAHLRYGNFRKAATYFRSHLARHPRGPWTLRARNHLSTAVSGARARAPGRAPSAPATW